jgi:hypothetical protein
MVMIERQNRKLLRFVCGLLVALTAFAGAFPLCSRVSAQEKPAMMINEDVQAFAISQDNRIIYAVQRMRRVKKVRLERDDMWISTSDGKQKKIVDGEKFFADPLLNYQAQSFAWSPGGHRIAIMMTTAEMTQPRGTKDEQLDEEQPVRGLVAIYLMEDDGRQIPIQGMKDGLLEDAFNAAWIDDGNTLLYLTKTGADFWQINSLRPADGKVKPLFSGHTFAAVAWDAKHSQAFAVEQSTTIIAPPTLVKLDLVHETRTKIAPLDAFAGNLTLSPSATKAGYFRDGDTLEVRDVVNPTAKPIQARVAIGMFEWGHDERRILLKRGDPQRSANLVWIGLYDGQFVPLLHDLEFHDFAISPDGEFVAVTEPGKRSLLLYHLQ